MRKVADLITDLGFNEEASLDVKRAFIRHLKKAADELSPQNLTPIAKQNSTINQPAVKKEFLQTEVQLSFDPELLKAK